MCPYVFRLWAVPSLRKKLCGTLVYYPPYLLTVSVIIQALVSWGHHWYCANPVKQKELNDLILEATRTSLEKYILERISNRLADLQDKDPLVSMRTDKGTYTPPLVCKHSPSLLEEKIFIQRICYLQNEKELKAADMTDGESTLSLVRKKQEWLRCVDRQIDFCLNEYLTLDSVTIVYSEVWFEPVYRKVSIETRFK